MQHNRHIARRFTFVEIMVAVAILGMSLAVTLTVIGSARARVMRAERRWARQHVLSNAAELFLLEGPDANVLSGLLPPGFSANCETEDVDDLPDHAAETVDGWKLVRFRVGVRNAGGQLVGEQTVEKLIVEEEER